MDGQVRLRLLGPVEIDVGGTWLRPPRPQQRLLLALLALSAGQVVSVSDLVDALWQDAPPPSARESLQVLTTRLRNLLAGCPGFAIRRYGDGYQSVASAPAFRSAVKAARPQSAWTGLVLLAGGLAQNADRGSAGRPGERRMPLPRGED